jgi:hypothetical protein
LVSLSSSLDAVTAALAVVSPFGPIAEMRYWYVVAPVMAALAPTPVGGAGLGA